MKRLHLHVKTEGQRLWTVVFVPVLQRDMVHLREKAHRSSIRSCESVTECSVQAE